jgi:hypothetical protein
MIFRHVEDLARQGRPDPECQHERACEHCGFLSQLNSSQKRVSCGVQERWAMMARIPYGSEP